MPGGPTPTGATVVIATRNRRAELLGVLDRLAALSPAPPVIVVDNGSDDGSAEHARRLHPGVRVIELGTNLGAAARTVGVAAAATPYVAFADDDSWWAPGALDRAVAHLRRHPAVALVAARILLGVEERLEPLCAELAASPLGTVPGDPGPTILGFIACGAVVEREAFLAVGGFHPRLGVGGEESLVALDLAARGRRCVYADDVVAHHHPSPVRDRTRRRRIVVRNHLWTTWLRQPAPAAVRETGRVLRSAWSDPAGRAGVGDAVRGLPALAGGRRVVPPAVAAAVRRLEGPPVDGPGTGTQSDDGGQENPGEGSRASAAAMHYA
jgi:GT2 family glycosyltransferase